MATLALVISGVAAILSGVSILLHVLAPRTKTLLDDHAAAVIDRLVERLKSLTPPLALAVVFFASAFGAAQLGACSHNARQDTIAVALSTVEATRTTFEAYDAHHQAAIVDAAPDLATGKAQLAAYRATRAPFVEALKAAYIAIEAAARLNDDASLQSMLGAAARVAAEWSILQGAK